MAEQICVPDLVDLDTAASCDELDNMGGVAAIHVAYHKDIATFPQFPTLSSEKKSFADAGAWDGDFVMKDGKKFAKISFKDEAANLTFAENGDKGSLKVMHTLVVSRNKIEAISAGFSNAVRNMPLVIVVEDNNGVKYILGDKRVPCRMASGQNSTVGEKHEDTSMLSLQFEYSCPRLLVYNGNLPTSDSSGLV